MQLEKGKMASSQLTFLVAGIIQCSSLMVGFATRYAKQDIWWISLAALLVYFLISLFFLNLVVKFPGKNIIQINDIIFGPYVGKFISIQYLGYFFFVLVAFFQFIGEFVVSYIMPETPQIVIEILFFLICAWTLRKGVEVIGRVGLILSAITIVLYSLTFFLLLKDMEPANFFPVMDVPLKDMLYSLSVLVGVSFANVFVLLMLMPYVNIVNQVKRAFRTGLVIGGVSLFFISVQYIAVLGDSAAIMVLPYYEAVRQINIANVFTRMEILVAIGLMFTLFIGIITAYYATTLGVAQLLKLRSYAELVLPIGIIALNFSLVSYKLSIHMARKESAYLLYISFQLLLPLASLVVAKIRKLPSGG
ncbi:hypothetical protein A7K50_04795 [Dehalobacter sp. MCB1]|uniref:GerAB/ArcD/ProY family transporter n=1 Tax=unclassified Dehalobacter TaxID=2635733 RepID=UPI000E6BD253|nr:MULTISPECIES: endospore germination permease [unclassified Dehalobacter]RJE47291.1 hypothetical protein A7K50_04795 [Dehalobacter sp. MCB1]TCX54860.1 spore gernimation protein [Dehalobacter sp. 12DCB1]